MKEIKIILNPPFFYFHGNCGKVCPADSNFFLAYLVPLVPLRVDFSKMAAVAMEAAKMLKKIEKHKNNHSRLLAKQKLMKLDRNNIHMNKPKNGKIHP
jgi:hypothetical protein